MLANDCCWFPCRHSSCVWMFMCLFTILNSGVLGFIGGFSWKASWVFCCLHSPFQFVFVPWHFFFLSARLTLPYFSILTTPPPPTSHAQLPIKIHFFHFSPESDIPNGFLCFPISSVSSSHPSSTHWHVFFYHSPSHLSDYLRKEWKQTFLHHFLSRVAGKSCLLPSDCNCHFLQLYFSMSSSPNWDNSNLFWQPTHSDKLLMDGHGCTTAMASSFHLVQEGVCF